MSNAVDSVASFVATHNGINDKAKLRDLLVKEFALTRDRSVFYCADFAIRFSSANSPNFSNTVLSLSNLQKYDDRPFLVCVVTRYRSAKLLATSYQPVTELRPLFLFPRLDLRKS
jgi:hypothetical protein